MIKNSSIMKHVDKQEFVEQIIFEGGDRRINMKNRTYISIDLKSFYASVECIERGLDPLTTNLVNISPT